MEEMSLDIGDSRIRDETAESKHITLGVCAMTKKSRSKPMLEILERLAHFEYIKPLIFEEDVILSKPVDEWPICDCLISFHSKGFPLDKAVAYAELRKPLLINDLYMQYKIQDRRKVHSILDEQNIDQARYAVLDRDSSDQTKCQIVETEDHIEVNNVTFHKPFVEKPVNAEDHNVFIYFPASAGGGSQRLFRKIGSRSSVYSPISSIRKTGSFIYEDFMPTDGTDVKVYTVGPDYAHAEARKSPALDGKVERDKDGKEIRYPVLLSAKEKLLARKVCLAFKQSVCGFDLLRANGRSYVCDVNGFSFVKTSPKYYDDCAKILGNMIMRDLAPQFDIPYSITFHPEDIPIVPTTYGTMMELRCVIAVIRHGDRTPKQKMKMEVRHKKFFTLFEKYGGFKTGHLKLKRPKQLQEVLDISRFLLDGIEHEEPTEVEENRAKLEQLKAVLEMYGHFSGINRKIQFKYQPFGAPKRSSSDDDDQPKEPSLVLILKWGGELTPAGKIQAEELGKAFRCMYPGGQGDYGGSPGLGLMRLQSTFRHDLKIYASDEGRVQMTAAAFAKGLLALEGELTPILVQMVKSANMNGLLDNDNEASNYQNILKEKLQCTLNQDKEFDAEDQEKLIGTNSYSLRKAMEFIKNPYAACCQIHDIMQQLLIRINTLKDDPRTSEIKLYHGESWELMTRRWSKLVKDFKSHKHHTFDISKIPDIYDNIKYDLQHNMKILRFPAAEELHALSKAMADIVIPQEYGITQDEKLMIGQRICTPLLRKILTDIQRNIDEESTRLDSRYSEGVSSPHRHVRTRLYFTSESHIHSLLTVLRYGGLLDSVKDEQWARAMDYIDRVTELNYMTQIVIMTYEDPTKDPQSDERFHLELHFSPGAYCAGPNKHYPPGPGYRSQMDKKREEEKKQFRDVATAPGELKLMQTEDNDNSPESAPPPNQQTTPLISEQQGTDSACAVSDSPKHKVAKMDSCATDDSVTEHCEMETESVVDVCRKDSDTLDPSLSSGHVTFDICNDMSVDEIPAVFKESTGEESERRGSVSMRRVSDSAADDINKEHSESVSLDVTDSTPASTRRRHQSAEGCIHAKDSSQDSDNESSNYRKYKQGFYDKFLLNPQKCASLEDSVHLKSTSCEKDHADVRRRSFLSLFATKEFEKLAACRNSIISTNVISGSASAPDLTHMNAGVDGWRVSSIRPLETLHNSLTLKQMEMFLAKVMETTGAISFSSDQNTPTCVTPRSQNNSHNLHLPLVPGSISAGSSSGPSSPTCVSSPDDILTKLKQLIRHTSESVDSTSPSSANS